MFTIKQLFNILYNGIYKFAKLLFDHADLPSSTIMTFEHTCISQSNNNYRYCTVSIPIQTINKILLAMNIHVCIVIQTQACIGIPENKKKIKMLSSQRRPCCHAKLK